MNKHWTIMQAEADLRAALADLEHYNSMAERCRNVGGFGAASWLGFCEERAGIAQQKAEYAREALAHLMPEQKDAA